MVLCEVESAFKITFSGNTRPAYLGKAIVFRGKNAQSIFYFSPHFFGMSFSAEKGKPEFEFALVYAFSGHGLGQVKGVRRSSDQHS